MSRFLSLLILCFGSLPLNAEQAASPVPEGTVARAQFTSAIVDREPVDQLAVVSPPLVEVFFFTDLRHLEGRTITHRWEYQGRVLSQVSFEVKGPRWRVFSKKLLQGAQFGDWSVIVLDQSGWPLHTELLRYEPAIAEELAPPSGLNVSQ